MPDGENASSQQPSPPRGFPPCPGCGKAGHSVQEWEGEDETQLWNCTTEDCRVSAYKPRDCDPQEKPGDKLL